MDDVKVHYNSSKPAQLQAHAYAQGSNIHIGPGQEKHLAHEAWHVVQQKQGRVKPTMQMKGKVNINDDASLEREADVMGAKALQMAPANHQPHQLKTASTTATVQAKLSNSVLNVAGETHDEYEQLGNETLRDKEKKFASQKAGGSYWQEPQFKVTDDSTWYGKNKGESGDPVRLQFLQCVELIDSLCGKFIPMLDHNVKDEAKMLRERVEEGVRTIGGGVTERYKEMGSEHSSGVRSLSDSQADAAQKISPKLTEMSAKCKAIYDLIQSDGTLNPGADKQIAALKVEAVKLNKEIKTIAAVLHNKTALTQSNVRIPRSKAMHFSAQASHATKGIWKVGNNHYDDIKTYIKGLFVGAPKYNLMSKADFNKERDAFKPK
ncbi:translation initiation factor 2 [Vibrio maritimus]|uniref:Translation initiation factor 2 n=1 Tax=Vibrio maritimus TaxID=990268 RepID=A0A090T636_9VIBR|nr:translation initiation factor 2 [Vibrio maritimus]